MTIEDIQTICHQFAGVTEDIKLGSHLCFNVGGKTFLFTSPVVCPCRHQLKCPPRILKSLYQKKVSRRRNTLPATNGYILTTSTGLAGRNGSFI